MNDRTTVLIIAVLLLVFFSRGKRRRPAGKMQPEKPKAKTPQKITPDKPGGWLAYRERLAKKESSGKYDARRPNSKYWGRYQLGPLARRVGGAQGVRWAQYQNDQALQDAAVKRWTARLYQELRAQKLARQAVDAGTLHGEKVTWAFLVAMDHLTGRTATMKWLRTGQTTKDANKVSNVDWARGFAPFSLSELEKGAA